MASRVLVAGMGNELLGDDGFGIAAARACSASGLGPEVTVVEAGIAGIGLVQDLMEGYEVVVILDAVDRGAAPGSLHTLEITVPDLERVDPDERERLVMDMHYTVPSRVMLLAQALDVLPEHAYLVGCQPHRTELAIGLSPAVSAAIGPAVERVRHLVAMTRAVPRAAAS